MRRHLARFLTLRLRAEPQPRREARYFRDEEVSRELSTP